VQTSPLRFDFFADFAGMLSRRLAARGHVVDPTATPREIATLYTNLERRRIDVRPRSVHVASGLICPPVRQAGFDLVSEKARTGADLNPHLSRTVADDADYDDMMLNDWAMHHLHLGTQIGADGLATRTGELLFAIVRPDNIYFVAVGGHGDWAAKRLLDAAHSNWPELFAGRFMRMRVDPLPEDDYKKLRNAGVFVVPTLSTGEAVYPLGGGSSTSRRAIEVTIAVDQLARELREWEARMIDFLPGIREALSSKGARAEDLEFHLKMTKDRGWVAFDEKTKIAVVLESK
jgi:hypothetical protein